MLSKHPSAISASLKILGFNFQQHRCVDVISYVFDDSKGLSYDRRDGRICSIKLISTIRELFVDFSRCYPRIRKISIGRFVSFGFKSRTRVPASYDFIVMPQLPPSTPDRSNKRKRKIRYCRLFFLCQYYVRRVGAAIACWGDISRPL